MDDGGVSSRLLFFSLCRFSYSTLYLPSPAYVSSIRRFSSVQVFAQVEEQEKRRAAGEGVDKKKFKRLSAKKRNIIDEERLRTKVCRV